MKRKICLDDLTEEWFEKNITERDSFFFYIFKIFEDIFFGFFGIILMILFYPLFFIIIKLESRGSIFYKQERIGMKGKIFKIYKFRTMYENYNKDGEKWREKDKNSITKFGGFLRWTHLDELPQAINILKGDLSFVGPRAEWAELSRIFEKEIKFYKKRYLVKPGMIGWAQINLPASKSVEEARNKFEYDLYYIKNRSWIFDLEIILKSVKLYFF